jgi:hypothetical protein
MGDVDGQYVAQLFEYMRQEYLLDALVDYPIEPDDPQRSVPNPLRKAVDGVLRKARAHIDKLKQTYGEAVLGHPRDATSTVRMLNAARKKIKQQIQDTTDRIKGLRVRQKSLHTRMPLAQALPNQDLVKLSTERKHLTNVLKLLAYQIESDLVNLIRPHYARTDDEGRTLIQTALQSAASIEPSDTELRVTLCPLSSAHRSHALVELCETLNRTQTSFPGTQLRMRFAVAATEKADRKPTGHVRRSEVTEIKRAPIPFDPLPAPNLAVGLAVANLGPS